MRNLTPVDNETWLYLLGQGVDNSEQKNIVYCPSFWPYIMRETEKGKSVSYISSSYSDHFFFFFLSQVLFIRFEPKLFDAGSLVLCVNSPGNSLLQVEYIVLPLFYFIFCSVYLTALPGMASHHPFTASPWCHVAIAYLTDRGQHSRVLSLTKVGW